MQNKAYIRSMDEQSSLYEYYARKQGLQGKSLQLLLWISNYTKTTGRYLTQKQLAEKTYSTKQVVNATIKCWQKKGFIELMENPADKRHKYLTLTPEGQLFADGIILPLNALEQQALLTLSAEEQATLIALTQRYNTALKLEMEKTLDRI